MYFLEPTEIEAQCKDQFPKEATSHLRNRLQHWMQGQARLVKKEIAQFRVLDFSAWPQYISAQASALHPWYEYLASSASLSDFASFLREEAEMPAFVPLLTSVRDQMPEQLARDTLNANIQDELYPVPHSQLFKDLLANVRTWSDSLPHCDNYLSNTNLVYFYGYFQDPWFAAGALYATEFMLPRRAALMLKGLKRLGFSEQEAKFMSVHALSDVAHAQEWLEGILGPAYDKYRESRLSILLGITIRLRTSEEYLNRVFRSRINSCQNVRHLVAV